MAVQTVISRARDADPLDGYFGSKGGSGVAARIIAEMPPHDIYAELFAGSARVARLKRPAKGNLLFDIDPEVISKLKACKEDWATFFSMRVRDAFQVLDWNLCSLKLPTTLLYLDPPYPACVRGRDRYRFDMRDDDVHRGLCLSLSRLKCMVIISSYPNEIYDGLLPEWRTVDIPTMTQGGKRTERLWCNFPKPTYLHDPDFAGRTHWARWNIAKRNKRMHDKYLALPPAERQALFAALAAADTEVVRLHK